MRSGTQEDAMRMVMGHCLFLLDYFRPSSIQFTTDYSSTVTQQRPEREYFSGDYVNGPITNLRRKSHRKIY
jgi:hypothetical protein